LLLSGYNSWPSHIPAGARTERLGCTSDLFATTASILHAPVPEDAGEDSFDLLPVLLDKANQPVRTSIVHHAENGMFAIREGNWKLVLGLGSGGFSPERIVQPAEGGPKGQLYDLANNPRESHNLYQENPELVEHLSQLLHTFQLEGRSNLSLPKTLF
jgi:arylsulfatase A